MLSLKPSFTCKTQKKLNCPASITLRDTVFFPDFKIRYIKCIFSLFFLFFPSFFFIINCKMNLINKIN